jgi:hypothetical protein
MGAGRVKVGRVKSSDRRPGSSNAILAMLAGGDRRSIGRANQAAAIMSKDLSLIPELMTGLWSEDPLVRMRAADAAEKVSRKNPDLLKPHKAELLGLMAEADQQELCWHLAAMVPRLALNSKERQRAAALFEDYLEDRSSIVKTLALQGLADLARNDSAMRPSVIEHLRAAERSGTPAMRARSRKLLARLDRA